MEVNRITGSQISSLTDPNMDFKKWKKLFFKSNGKEEEKIMNEMISLAKTSDQIRICYCFNRNPDNVETIINKSKEIILDC